MSEAVIEIEGLTKSFGTQAALDGLDLRVPAGSVFGFLGRNGAGKTTTIKHLLGLIKADRGSACIFGQPVVDRSTGVAIRRRIGFVTEDKDLYPYMTVDGIIRFTRPFFHGWRCDLEQRYLDSFELPRGKRVSQLSKGMRSKRKRVVPAVLPPRLAGATICRDAPEVSRACYRLLRTRWGANRKRPPLTSLVTTPS